MSWWNDLVGDGQDSIQYFEVTVNQKHNLYSFLLPASVYVDQTRLHTTDLLLLICHYLIWF